MKILLVWVLRSLKNLSNKLYQLKIKNEILIFLIKKPVIPLE